MKKLITLFAGMLIASAAWSDAVYEPLIISSGFNRDVIAEEIDEDGIKKFAESYYIYADPNGSRDVTVKVRDEEGKVIKSKLDSSKDSTKSVKYSYSEVGNIQYTFPTIKALHQQYPNFPNDKVIKLYNVEYKLFECGFPNDSGKVNDRRVNSIATNPEYAGLFFDLAPYTAKNALCLRNTKGMDTIGIMKFQTIGAYKKLHLMVISGGSPNKTSGNWAGMTDDQIDEYRKLRAIVYYSNGTTEDTTFTFYDHARVDKSKRVCHDNIFDNAYYRDGTWTSKLNCYAAVSDLPIDHTLLIDSIRFSLPHVRLNDNVIAPPSEFGIAIMAVTGELANIAAPLAESAQVNEIDANSFKACWEAIVNAKSYRLDVAEDENFQRILADYNNKEIDEGTCAEIANLVADHEYYWRVRAVDSEGGQSASSAPRRVRTESVDGPKATNDDDHNLKTNDITPLLNTTTNLTINRKLYKDGYYNTLCLPFDQSAADLAETTNPLYGFTIYAFDGATKIGDAQLDISVKVTDHIEAGVPYLLAWSTQTDEVLTSLEFKGVTITTDEGRTIGEPDKVQFVGNISTTGENGMENGNHNHLFIGANNELFWPNTSNGLKGFRAHFEVPASGPACVPRNSPARIVVQTNVATGVENTSANSAGAKKQLENGQLVIILDNIRYNVMGLQLR